MKINIANPSSLNKLKKEEFNVLIGGEYNLNKRILDNKKVNLLLDPEPLDDDFMNYKNSGLNQVLVKLAKKNNIGIGFSLNRLNSLSKLNKARLLGKIMQNIKLCNKYKVKVFIVNFVKDKYSNINDIKSLALSLKARNFDVIQEVV